MERSPMPCSGRINIVKNSHTTQSYLQISCDLYQIIHDIFHRARTYNLKFIWNYKRPRIAFWGYPPQTSDNITKLLQQSKTAWYCHKNRSKEQRKTDRSKEQNRQPRNKPTCLQSLTFNKGGKNIH